ncbi:hypothetical protein METHPM2_20042 [Pseudomonas sp. PM2]|jgi:hypothetical protein
MRLVKRYKFCVCESSEAGYFSFITFNVISKPLMFLDFLPLVEASHKRSKDCVAAIGYFCLRIEANG